MRYHSVRDRHANLAQPGACQRVPEQGRGVVHQGVEPTNPRERPMQRRLVAGKNRRRSAPKSLTEVLPQRLDPPRRARLRVDRHHVNRMRREVCKVAGVRVGQQVMRQLPFPKPTRKCQQRPLGTGKMVQLRDKDRERSRIRIQALAAAPHTSM